MRTLAIGSIATLVLSVTSVAAAAGAHTAKSSGHTVKTTVQVVTNDSDSDASDAPSHGKAAPKHASPHRVRQGKPDRTIAANAKKDKASKGVPVHHAEPSSNDQRVASKGGLPQLPPGKAGAAAVAARMDVPLARAEAPLERQVAPKVNLKPSCLRPSVTFVRGGEEEAFPLTRCDGSHAPLATERLSIMARASASKPAPPVSILAKTKGPILAPGIRRVDPRLVEQLQLVVDHFGSKTGKTARIHLVSGFRPSSDGSYHQTGHALDVHVEGVANEALVDFCKTLTDVGCGYYPNSSFVHMDVREPGTGHVSWIDASGPGESARYVEQWPPPAKSNKGRSKLLESVEDALAKLDKSGAPVINDDHPARPASAGGGSARVFGGKPVDFPDVDPRDRAAEAPAAALNVPADDEN